jgi:hypothetical protein
MFFLPHLHDITEGVINIVVFSSRCICKAKERDKRTHEVESGAHHPASLLGRMVPPLFLLMRLHIPFFYSTDVFP